MELLPVPERVMHILTSMIGTARMIAESGQPLAPIAGLMRAKDAYFSVVQLPAIQIDAQLKGAALAKAKRDAESALTELLMGEIKKHAVDTLLIINEVWGLRDVDRPRAEEILKQYHTLQEYPGKIDCVNFNLQTRDFGNWMGTVEMIPRGNGRTFKPVAWTSVSEDQLVLVGPLATILAKTYQS